jgi:transcriptional regulator with XRE-family HTH domain
MEGRILKFLNINNLNASQLADMLGVQRSSISHIISGRNKPSFDFINRMLNKFPEINANWLITGKGEMLSGNSSIKETEIFKNNDAKPESPRDKDNIEGNSTNEYSDITTKSKKITNVNINSLAKNIERVIIFYDDNSFEAYDNLS